MTVKLHWLVLPCMSVAVTVTVVEPIPKLPPEAGLATTVRRGEATMLARYEGSYTATTLIVMGGSYE